MSTERLVKFYDGFASSYDQNTLSAAMQYSGPQRIAELFRSQLAPNQKRVFELGIGTGLVAEQLHAIGLEVYGADISPKMIEECQKKGITKELCIHDCSDGSLPFLQIKFDAILSVGVLELIPSLPKLFQSVYDQLVPGGLFCFTAPTQEHNPHIKVKVVDGETVAHGVHEATGLHVHFRAEASLASWLQAAGFTIVQRDVFTGFVSKSTAEKTNWVLYLARRPA